MGKAHKLLLKGPEGEKMYQRALRVAPTSVMALTGMAELLIDNGRPLEAAVFFRKVLQVEAGNVEALSGLAATQKFKPDAPEINWIEKRLTQAGTKDDHLVLLHHAAGKILNDQGEYEKAIQHFAKGKEIKNIKFQIDMHEQLYDSFIENFDEAFFAERQGFGDPSERPVFIVGMPRSGTTLTEQICASHPKVYGAGELSDMRSLANDLGFADVDPKVFIDGINAMTREESVTMAAKYLDSLKQKNRTSQRIIDKMPHNYEFLALITLLFPNAKIINCNRDPMDNCVSCFMQNFSEAHGYNADLHTAGLYYRQYDRLMAHWNKVMPVPVLKMQYEETVADIDTRARALIDFIDLEWDDACLSFHKTERTVRTPSRWQVRQPIYATSVQRWKRYGDSLAPLKEGLGDLVEA